MIWRLLDVALLVAGAGCIVVGVAHWSMPAAWVTVGAACLAFGFLPPRAP